MRNLNRALILSGLLIFLIVILPTEGKSDSMQEMFQKWGFQATDTEPGVYEAQTRGFAVGGRASIRARNEMFQPVTLKAPSFKAGCGGIDIFGGAFSWINAEQFTKTMRAIGQNAVGYAFSLGLEWVCPTCSAQLNKLQHFMNQINKMSSDSCMAAQAMVNQAGGAMGLWQSKDCANQKGEAGDNVQGWLSCSAGDEASVRQKIRESSWMNSLPADSTWRPKPAKGGEDTTSQALKGQGISPEDRQLIVSYIGTVAMVGGKYDQTEAPQCKYIAPTLGFKDLIQGGSVKVVNCEGGAFSDEATCNSFGVEDKIIEGYYKKTGNILKQIYTKVATKTGAAKKLTTDEEAVVSRISLPPVYTLIDTISSMGVGGISASAEGILAMYGDAMAAQYAWATVDMYMQAVEGGRANITTACIAEDTNLKDGLRRIKEERYHEMQIIFNSIKAQAEATAFIMQIKKQLANKAQGNLLGLF